MSPPDYRRLSLRYLIAQKEHPCVLCPDPIRPGSRYVRLVSIEDGRFICDRRHYFCRASDPDSRHGPDPD